jgi:putative phosphotransacetylase
MSTSKEELVKQITKLVVEELTKMSKMLVPIGVSNKHIHLSRADMDVLFGEGSELHPIKDMKQPGQYACEECVGVRGPKGEFKKLRVLGPLRPETQVEISLTDARTIGIKAPIRESGKLEGTPGCEIIGPKGSVVIDHGVIVALRHIHMTPVEAKKWGLKDGDIVSVSTLGGERNATLGDVLVRVSEKYALEMHIDIDEANACCLGNNDYVAIEK